MTLELSTIPTPSLRALDLDLDLDLGLRRKKKKNKKKTGFLVTSQKYFNSSPFAPPKLCFFIILVLCPFIHLALNNPVPTSTYTRNTVYSFATP